MHIITRVNKGGTAKWLDVLLHGLQDAGHTVVLLAGNVQENEFEDDLFGQVQGIRISELGRSISIFSDLKSFFAIRKIIQRESPDLINTHTAKAGLIGRLAAFLVLRNRPLIVHTFHGHLLYGYFSPSKTKFFAYIEKIMAFLSNHLISAGALVRDDLLKAGIGSKSKYTVIRPGIQVPLFEDKAAIREAMHIRVDSVVVGWLGRFTQIKRPERVLEIASVFPNVYFLMGGDGHLFQQVSSSAPSNVILTGWAKPEDIWAAADISFLTSDNEALPISLVEASYAGLPAVAENVGAVSEVVSNGQTGFLVNGFEERKIALGKLINDQVLRSKFGEVARKKMELEYNADTFINSHLEVYRDLLSKKITS